MVFDSVLQKKSPGETGPKILSALIGTVLMFPGFGFRVRFIITLLCLRLGIRVVYKFRAKDQRDSAKIRKLWMDRGATRRRLLHHHTNRAS